MTSPPFPPVIGFCGPAGHGKTTAALFVVASCPDFYRISFADPIRQMLQALGLSAADLSTGKQQPHPLLGGKTPRHAMQTLGTEWGRHAIDPEIWLRCARERALAIICAGGRVVFDDVRFDNEAQTIRGLGGIVVGVRRPSAPLLVGHSSEAGVSPSLLAATLVADDLAGLGAALHSTLNAHAAC